MTSSKTIYRITAPGTNLLALMLPLFISACASQFRPDNMDLAPEQVGQGYSHDLHEWQDDNEGVQVFLAFSGGGTRAAALSYGVLSELRDTRFTPKSPNTGRLLDEVDSISSVSGGSFTAAYYGLYGDRIFEDYEQKFLKNDVQSTLFFGLFNPTHWWRSITTRFGLSEQAIEYYNQTMFEGATIGDLEDEDGPFIIINSTDLSTGNRFSFTQPTFDLICSDVNSYPVAAAVTASSAVPVVFNPIVLKNYGDSCHTPTHDLLDTMLENPELNLRQQKLAQNLDSLRDMETRPYVHLVDGGISDNLGLRALVDWTDALGEEEYAAQMIGREVEQPREIALILVNAARAQERTIDQSAEPPSIAEMLSAVSDVQMMRYTLETQMLIGELVEKAEAQFEKKGHPVKVHVIMLSIQDVEDRALFRRLNHVATTLELPPEQVDELIGVGRKLLRENEQYQAFINAVGAAAVE